MRTPVLIALTTFVSLAPAAEARRPPCSKGGETIAANRIVRVFENGSRLVACTKADRDRDVLARRFDDDYVTSSDYSHVRLAGSFVAWVQTNTDVSCKAACPPDYEPTRTHVTIRDAATDDERSTSVATVSELVLTRTGSAAWIDDSAVRALDDAGERTLDTGDVSALEASRSRVTWLNAGEVRAAQLG